MKKLKFGIELFVLILAMGGLYAEEIFIEDGFSNNWCGVGADNYVEEVFMEGGFRYAVENGKATIISFTNSDSDNENLVIPEKLGEYEVTSIRANAFRYFCENLLAIKIPNSIINIVASAFSGSSLTEITLSKDHPVYSFSNGVLFDKTQDILHTYLPSKKDVSYVIPNSVTSIGKRAFWRCESLERIEIPDSVTSIGESAFAHCESLETIEIPNSVTSIEKYVFRDCKKLERIEIPDSVTSIGESAFIFCESLERIEIPDSVTTIGEYAFMGCESLEKIEIPDSVTIIAEMTFWNCNSLTTIEIPDSVISIGESAFEYCYSLERIEIADSVTTIGDRAFYACDSLTEIVIPNSVMKIGELAFADCKNLKEIKIPNSVASIGNNAFALYEGNQRYSAWESLLGTAENWGRSGETVSKVEHEINCSHFAYKNSLF